MPAYAEIVEDVIGERTDVAPVAQSTYFTHDLDEELTDELLRQGDSQLAERFDDPCGFEEWPPIPIHAIAGCLERS